MSNLELVTLFHSQLKEYIKEYYKLQERNYRNAFTDHTCYTHLKIMEHLIESGDIDLMTQSLKEQCDSNQYQQQFGIKPNRPVLRFQEVVVWIMTNHRDVYETIFNQIHKLLLDSHCSDIKSDIVSAYESGSRIELLYFSVMNSLHKAMTKFSQNPQMSTDSSSVTENLKKAIAIVDKIANEKSDVELSKNPQMSSDSSDVEFFDVKE